MAHPFDDPDGEFQVLIDDSGRHRCLWPVRTAVPTGWRCEFGPADRGACLAHVVAASTAG